MIRTLPAAALLAAGFVSSLLSCAPAPLEPPEHVFRGSTMGTTFTVKVVKEASGAQVEEMGRKVREALDGVNDRMSTYREDSEISRLNAHGGGEPFPLSPQTREVLGRARQVSELSGGAFDVTVAPLVEAWGFGPAGQPPDPPTETELHELLTHVGYEGLELTAEGAVKADPELSCDLSAIAKGFAVDQVALALESLGADRYMVEVGGEVRTAGRSKQGRPWIIGIEGPGAGPRQAAGEPPATGEEAGGEKTSGEEASGEEAGREELNLPSLAGLRGQGLQRLLPLSGLAMATSGDYRNFYELDGKRYSHTIDPRTGEPVDHPGASVTVVYEDCTGADAWATALLVLGPQEGLALARREGLAALFLVYGAGGEIREITTPAFDALEGAVN